MIFKKALVQPKSLILIFSVTALIVISTALIELFESKKKMLDLMESHGHTLLESLLTSSANALTSYDKIESEITNRLLNNAAIIKNLYEKHNVSNSILENIAEENIIYRIYIVDKYGNKLYSSTKTDSSFFDTFKLSNTLFPIFEDEADTLIIGINQSKMDGTTKYAVALASANRSAIVLAVDANELMDYKIKFGFGPLLKSITLNKNIEYALLENEDGIIAASGNFQFFQNADIENSEQNNSKTKDYTTRMISAGETEIFEVLHPFRYADVQIGIFRLGLSMEPLNQINKRITERIIFIGVVLFVFGFVTITLIFTRQNFDLLSKRYKAMESYSEKIIENVNDGIIILDHNLKIKVMNGAAVNFFGAIQYLNKDIHEVLGGASCTKILESKSPIQQIECLINGSAKFFLVSKSILSLDGSDTNTVLIFSDLTEQILLERQIQTKNRMAAMGELASSVAHEIRNPLNAIGTITQQLNKDFIPTKNVEEYKSLSQLVYREVKRINETIENFLRFAKPLPLKPYIFILQDFFSQIEKQYSPLLNSKNIRLSINGNYNRDVRWDQHQIQQVIINLIENSIDAINEDGIIDIKFGEKKNDSNKIEIIFSDSGKGIPTEIMDKIFNLYFTTKSKGSGIGLSIVQKIIYEHSGTISAENYEQGAMFRIIIPKLI